MFVKGVWALIEARFWSHEGDLSVTSEMKIELSPT